MSTRCQIGFYEPESKDLGDFEAVIYRHCDGYPESVLPAIVPILKDFDIKRGLGDVEYSSAWLVAKLKDGYINIGICRDINHIDIRFFYAVYPDRVDVYKVGSIGWDNWTREKFLKTFKKIHTEKLRH